MALVVFNPILLRVIIYYSYLSNNPVYGHSRDRYDQVFGDENLKDDCC